MGKLIRSTNIYGSNLVIGFGRRRHGVDLSASHVVRIGGGSGQHLTERRVGGWGWADQNTLFFGRFPAFHGQPLHCSVNSFRFLGFLLWFVLGPGGLREAPGGPGKAHG